MTKKVLIFVIILFALTGCKVEYHIDIDERFNIDEKTEITATTNDEVLKIEEFNLYVPDSKKIDDYGTFQKKIEGIKYYDTKKYDNKIAFKNKFKIEDYKDSTLAALGCRKIATANPEEKILMISTETDFVIFDNYPDIEELKVVIHTNYDVLDSNADEVGTHSYTWLLTPDNYKDKYVYLKIDVSKENLTLKEKILRGDFFNIFTLFIVLALVGLIVLFILKRRSICKNRV